MLSLTDLNAATPSEFVRLLEGLYEHSPWVAERAAAWRPFASRAALQWGFVRAVREAGLEAQRTLLCAHPELAGQALRSGELTTESRNEQARVGLTHCTIDELSRLQQLNAAYRAQFGWPFIVAVRGPRGTGLSPEQIIATLERRLHAQPAAEWAECLRQVHRIAELRLNERLGHEPVAGNWVWDRCEEMAQHSDAGQGLHGPLTVTYLTPAHQHCARQITEWMSACGFDSVHTDAVGNVVGVFEGTQPEAPRLMMGSHYDTVRNAGKYDGRLGILVPMVVVRELAQSARRLPFGIEVIAFAEEEGQRFRVAFLGSSALTGQFDPAWFELLDADGISLKQAMLSAGLKPQDIPALARDPKRYLGFVEVHVEQGPVLQALGLPLGIVSGICGSVRYDGEVMGVASHAGTTPMNQRRDAAMAVAELGLFIERRAMEQADVVATMGQLHVPQGSVNVIPGCCQFSLDIRSPLDAVRDAFAAEVRDELARIAQQRGVRYRLTETLRAAAAPSDAAGQARWARAVGALGLPEQVLSSGAGHDAMKLHARLPQAMLFVRGENGGISHNPLESTTSDDMDCAVQALRGLLEGWVAERSTGLAF